MRPLPDPTQNKRHRLLEAAVILFAKKGFDSVGIREIAQKAQANSALVQYYFGSKEGLYLAAMQFLFDHGIDAVGSLPPPPSPSAPEAFREALACLRGYIRAFLEELFACHDPEQCPPELHAAAHIFWTREMLEPTPGCTELILNRARTYMDYMGGCLRALRPELDEEAIFLMGSSIHSQIMFFHRDMPMIALLRGAPYGPQDIEKLAAHITAFSLRGLGLEGAIQGA